MRVDAAAGRRELVQQRWGISPAWGLAKGITRPLINIRAETLATRPTFRDAFLRRRCLIPADGFYEWQSLGNAKQPWFVRLNWDGMFAFAGLWEPGGKPGEPDSCAIITTQPVPWIAPIHDRMPAVPQMADYGPWLDPKVTDAAKLAGFLEPRRTLLSAEGSEMYTVQATVNRATHDQPDCIAAAP